MLESLFRSFEPDCDRLLRAVSTHITDHMLQEIAHADHGLDAEKYFAALLPVRDEGRFVGPIHMFPCEVLELIRNSHPEDPDWKPGSSGVRGHWLRAFSSAALLRAKLPPYNYGGDAASGEYSLIQLVLSLDALPIDFAAEALQFISWQLVHTDPERNDEGMLYGAVALLWLAFRLPQPPADVALVELCEWIVLREAQLAEALPGGFDWWLLGIHGSSPPPSPWSELGARLRDLDLSGHSVPIQDWTHLIGAQLAG